MMTKSKKKPEEQAIIAGAEEYCADEFVSRLTKEEKTAAMAMSKAQVRFYVDSYYQAQDDRKRHENQLRSLRESGEPTFLAEKECELDRKREARCKNLLAKYAEAQAVGQWAMSICGIGPVITAGLIAYIDMNRAQAVSNIWAYAGYDPNRKKTKGEKFCYNPSFKTLCWKIGESFVKVSGRESDFYGKQYLKFKEQIVVKNEAGDYAEQAMCALTECNYGKDTEAYKAYSAGKLPAARIYERAKRKAVKLFLSHLWAVWYEINNGKKPPMSYARAHLNHIHEIPAPNWPC